MRMLAAVGTVISIVCVSPRANACLSVMDMARVHEETPAERLTKQLDLAERGLNHYRYEAALAKAESVLADPEAAYLPRAIVGRAHHLAARAAFALERADLVDKHFAAAIKAVPKLQKDYIATQILMLSWRKPVVAPALPATPVLTASTDTKSTMDAVHWAALAEARFMTHDEKGGREAVREGLKVSPKDQALLDLKARLEPDAIEETYSNY